MPIQAILTNLRSGRPQLKALDRDVDLPSQAFDSAVALNAVFQDDSIDSFVAGLAPPHDQYRALKGALATARLRRPTHRPKATHIGFGKSHEEYREHGALVLDASDSRSGGCVRVEQILPLTSCRIGWHD